MLVHLGQAETAETIKNAWLTTLESGHHTADIFRPQLSTTEVGTKAFTDAIIQRIGQQPRQLAPVHYRQSGITVAASQRPPDVKELVGIDVFLDWNEHDRDPQALGDGLRITAGDHWNLKMITNRGVKVYPDGMPETFCADHWRCRFLPTAEGPTTTMAVLELQQCLAAAGYGIIKTEHLFTFASEPGYSLGQGE